MTRTPVRSTQLDQVVNKLDDVSDRLIKLETKFGFVEADLREVKESLNVLKTSLIKEIITALDAKIERHELYCLNVRKQEQERCRELCNKKLDRLEKLGDEWETYKKGQETRDRLAHTANKETKGGILDEFYSDPKKIIIAIAIAVASALAYFSQVLVYTYSNRPPALSIPAPDPKTGTRGLPAPDKDLFK